MSDRSEIVPFLHLRKGSGQDRYPAEVIEAARVLVEASTFPMREIAARVGVGRSVVTKLRARHGWTRPGPARVANAGRRGGGHPVVPEAVEAARALTEGTGLSYAAIAERTGVSRTTLCRWRKERGWRRPAEAPGFLPGPRADGRARPTRYRTVPGKPYAADAVDAARALLMGTLLSQKAIAERIGVSQWWIGQLLQRRGWARPAVRPGSKRFAAAARTGPLAAAGDRRGRPYAPDVRREARQLWEGTRMGTAIIGARVGVHPGTVARWAKTEGWTRPRGRAGARQLRGFFGSGKARG